MELSNEKTSPKPPAKNVGSKNQSKTPKSKEKELPTRVENRLKIIRKQKSDLTGKLYR